MRFSGIRYGFTTRYGSLETGFRYWKSGCADFVKDEKKERIAGCVLWFGVVIASVGIPWGLLYLVGKVSFWLQFALETFWCYQLLAGKCLKDESRKVYVRLVNHNLEGARHAVSMIVGRDTGNLSEAGVTKAAVETVAENTSDGVIAPLIFMLIGGAPLGFFYKAVYNGFYGRI